MIHLVDGPAKGQNLMLRRAPFLLRVTEHKGTFDALDLVEDEPFPGESVHAYVQVSKPSWCHLRIAKPGRSGFYMIADYKFIEPQPTAAEMDNRPAWEKWCNDNAGRLGWPRAK